MVRGNERWVRYLFSQFISGLKKIHDKDIAHLDIKIDNVLLDIVEENGIKDLRLKIADFGIS